MEEQAGNSHVDSLLHTVLRIWGLWQSGGQAGLEEVSKQTPQALQRLSGPRPWPVLVSQGSSGQEAGAGLDNLGPAGASGSQPPTSPSPIQAWGGPEHPML